jgi:ubiquinone/menaquinone biosynthesis C-methylase UbiE
MTLTSTVVSPSVNHWPNARCAKAFWTQSELPPYRQLLADTTAWLEPAAGQRWLDLGCGGGQLTRALWEKSGGTLADIVALDCAAANEAVIGRLRKNLQPAAPPERVRFLHVDFSGGLADCQDNSFDGVVYGRAFK